MVAESQAPLISIIILNYNGAHLLREELPSVVGQSYPNMEIIVVDNGSHDDSGKVAEQFGVRFVSLGRNLYFGGGNNEGAKVAKGEYLYFINNDMRFSPSVVSELSAVIRSDSSIFALDIKQYDWEGKRKVRGVTRMRRGGFVTNELPWLHFDVSDDTEGPVEVPYASGASLFCRRNMFETLGGFDPTFHFDNEDLDLCWRAWLRGWRTVYLPHIFCFHKVGASFGDTAQAGSSRLTLTPMGLFRRKSRAKNTLRFCMKTMSWAMLGLAFIRQGIVALGFLAIGQWRRAIVFPQAWSGLLRESHEVMRLRRELCRQRTLTSRQLIRKFLNPAEHAATEV
jgi:GT2 family glycosyltransferase